MDMLFSYTARTHLVEKLRRLLGGPVPHVQVAALPWRTGLDGKMEILLVTSRDTGRWILPKGWPEGGETLAQSALREAQEEAGISGKIRKESVGYYYYDKRLETGLAKRCIVQVFPIEVTELTEDWPEKGQRARDWVSPEKAASMVDEGDLGELITEFAGNPRLIAA
jgi:8-oxo-dGTP pyrophosphatase MutT (NUDIX family)